MLKSRLVKKERKLILASASPRRNELLKLLGIPFVSHPADIDEHKNGIENPRAYVERMAFEKGEAVPAGEDVVVLSADTIVDLDGRVLGKPGDDAQAEEFLRLMRGRTHRVHTALSLHFGNGDPVLSDVCLSPVPMRAYADAEISAYVARGSYRDKAGGYAIQDEAFHPVEKVPGCYANVMGLPLCHVYRLLRQAGFAPNTEIARDCQRYNGICCTVYPLILQVEQDE